MFSEAFQRKNEQREAVFQLARSTGADQVAENQTEIERAYMNQLPLEDILMTSQMSPPHGPGIVTMREATLDQLAPLTKQALAISP